MNKIAFIIPNIGGNGGSERVTVNLANELSRYFEVTIISVFSLNATSVYPLSDTIRIINCNIQKSKYLPGKIDTLFRLIQVVKNLHDIFKNEEFRFILPMSFMINWACLATRTDDTKVFVCEHRDVDSISIYYKVMRNIFYKKADKIIVLTDTQKKKLLSKYSNIVVIPNFITHKIITHKESNIITYLGRIDHEKRVELLLKAFLAIDNQQYILQIVGDGPLYEELRNAYSSYTNIHFLGFVSDVEDIWLHTLLSVLPSRSEAFPMTILEAMAKGVPTIGFNVPGVTDLISDSHNGIIVQQQTINALSIALETILHDTITLKKLSKNCLKDIEQFNVNFVLQKWLQLFNES